MKNNYCYVFCDFETTGLFDFKDPDKKVYPIEVGLIFTDENYVIYDMYESLVSYDKITDSIKRNQGRWPGYAVDAFNIHKIDPVFYTTKSKDYLSVSFDIYDKIEKLKLKYDIKRFILFSDNIQFEFKLMEFLLRDFAIKKGLKWPFHYCGYDSSEFLIKTGIGDPKPEHRALRDAALLHQHMVRASEKITK